METNKSLTHLVVYEEERLGLLPVERLSEELRRAIEETRQDIRDAFKGNKKFPASLKATHSA